jgi:hypothetical protein
VAMSDLDGTIGLIVWVLLIAHAVAWLFTRR